MADIIVIQPEALEAVVKKAVAEALAAAGTTAKPAPAEARPKERLWTADDVAAYLDVSPRQVSERYAARPDFPAPVCLPTIEGAKRTRRWFPADIQKWARSHKTQNKAA